MITLQQIPKARNSVAFNTRTGSSPANDQKRKNVASLCSQGIGLFLHIDAITSQLTPTAKSASRYFKR